MDNMTNATQVWLADSSSKLRSDTPDELKMAAAHARSLGMGCHIAPYIDPNFDDMRNCRGPSCGLIPGTPKKAGRGDACHGCTPEQWAQFFSSYGAFMLLHARVAQESNCEILSIGSELAGPFKQTHHWRSLIKRVRAVYDGKLTIALNSGQAIPNGVEFLDDLDLVGVEGYYKLKAPPVATHEELMEAWKPIVRSLEAFHKWHGKQILFTEVGYQSRRGTHIHPASTNATDPFDCSCTPLCSDPTAQARAYNALLSTMYPKPWFEGVNWWLWRADPTAGGTTDYTFTPQGKPMTLNVIQNWYKWYS